MHDGARHSRPGPPPWAAAAATGYPAAGNAGPPRAHAAPSRPPAPVLDVAGRPRVGCRRPLPVRPSVGEHDRDPVPAAALARRTCTLRRRAGPRRAVDLDAVGEPAAHRAVAVGRHGGTGAGLQLLGRPLDQAPVGQRGERVRCQREQVGPDHADRLRDERGQLPRASSRRRARRRRPGAAPGPGRRRGWPPRPGRPGPRTCVPCSTSVAHGAHQPVRRRRPRRSR